MIHDGSDSEKPPDTPGNPPRSEKPLVRRPSSSRRQLQISIPFSSGSTVQHLAPDRLLSSVLIGAPVFLVVLDAQLRLTFVDGKAIEYFHNTPAQLIGSSILELFPDSPELRKGLDQALAGTTVKATHSIANRILRSTLLPLPNQSGAVTGVVFVATDVTPGGLLEGEPAPGAAGGEQSGTTPNPSANHLLHVSHELRTPLNSLVGFASLLGRTKNAQFTDQERFYLERIISNATHLLNVVSEMLDLSLAQSANLRPSFSDEDLGILISETIDDLRGLQTNELVSVGHLVPNDLLPLRTDRQKLKRVLVNLVANAIKYTRQGSVTVEVEVDEFHRPVLIKVTDTGEGIPDDRHNAIFDAFERGTHTADESVEGAGLGLSISRSLCESMGYTIGVESEVGKGSTFSIRLMPQRPAAVS